MLPSIRTMEKPDDLKAEAFIPMIPEECLRGIRKDFHTAQQRCNANGHYRLVITPKRFTIRRPDQSSIYVDVKQPGCRNSRLLHAYYRLVSHEAAFQGITIEFNYWTTPVKNNGGQEMVTMMILKFKVSKSHIMRRDAISR